MLLFQSYNNNNSNSNSNSNDNDNDNNSNSNSNNTIIRWGKEAVKNQMMIVGKKTSIYKKKWKRSGCRKRECVWQWV